MRWSWLVVAAVVALGPVVAVAVATPSPGNATRYEEALAKDPHDVASVAKLIAIHRAAGTLDVLAVEYRKLPADWARLVVLGHIETARGDGAAAVAAWEWAVKLRADDAETWVLIGKARAAGKAAKEALAAFDKALAVATKKSTKLAALHGAIDAAIAAGNAGGSEPYFKQLVALEPRDAPVWIEYGDVMLAAAQHQAAIDAYKVAEGLLASDPGRRGEVVARQGQVLERLGKDDDAIATYDRAIAAAPRGYYLEVELTGRIIDIHRRHQTLPVLLAQREAAWPVARRGHFEWSTLGKLYEEIGESAKALAALQKAVAKSPYELDTQRRLIQLLENSGRDDDAIAQYEIVARVAPGEPRFQLELAQRLLAKGRDKRALEVLDKLEGHFPKEPGVLAAIADLYTRFGMDDRAKATRSKIP